MAQQMTPDFPVDELHGQVKNLTLSQQAGFTVRTFGFKEEHKVRSLFSETFENIRSGSLIFNQDQGEATEVPY